jgi:hypothetical protein
MNVDNKHWETVDPKLVADPAFQVLRPADGVATQILYSINAATQAREPLCALQILVEAPHKASQPIQRAVLYSRAPSDSKDVLCRTHALINVDGPSGVPVSLVLTNFTQERLYMPIMHTDASGNKSGGLLNAINVLEPRSSLSVTADATFHNRRILVTTTNSNISVKQDEQDAKANNKSTQGLYLFVSVQPPQASQTLKDLFKTTRWLSDVEYVTLRVPPPLPAPSNWSFGTDESPGFGFGSDGRSSSRGFEGPFSNQLTRSLQPQSFGGQTHAFGLQPQGFGSATQAFGLGFGAPTNSFTATAASGSGFSAAAASGTFAPFSTTASFDFAFSAPADRQNLIDESKAAMIKHGEKVNVNAVDCTVQFATDSTSERCVLGISISTGLQFAPLGPVDGDKIKILVSAHQHNFLHLLDSKPFIAAECVICLDDKPDTILYPCRHQCVHFACIKDMREKSCPVCRAAIRACDTPSTPIIPHPKPERRAQQMIPMAILIQERELSKRMLEIEREKSNKAAAAASKTKEAVAVLQSVLSTIDQLKPAIKSVIDPPVIPMKCTKGHLMNRITKSPYAPHYQHYTCDRCHVVHSDSIGAEGIAAFHHCFTCANFDLCPACSRQ